MEDFGSSTVGQGAVDSDRSLSGARYGVVAVQGYDGTVEDLPGCNSGPLRAPDMPGDFRSLGIPKPIPPVAVSELEWPS